MKSLQVAGALGSGNLLSMRDGSCMIPGLARAYGEDGTNHGKEAHMKSIMLSLAVGLCLAIPAAAEDEKPQTPPPAAAAAAPHGLVVPVDLKWGAPPPALPKGSRLRVLSGDPCAARPHTIRAKLPPGYKGATHWPPTEQYIT